MAHSNHDRPCRCLFRLFEVAGELNIPDRRPEPLRASFTPSPEGLPFTGLHLAMSEPPTVIVSELLADARPAGYQGGMMLLDPGLSQPEIALQESDFEEIADLFGPRDRSALPAPSRLFAIR